MAFFTFNLSSFSLIRTSKSAEAAWKILEIRDLREPMKNPIDHRGNKNCQLERGTKFYYTSLYPIEFCI